MSEDEVSLPAELSWEQMEEGILAKMEDLEKSRKGMLLLYWKAGLAVLLLLIAFPFLINLYRGGKRSEPVEMVQNALVADSSEYFCNELGEKENSKPIQPSTHGVNQRSERSAQTHASAKQEIGSFRKEASISIRDNSGQKPVNFTTDLNKGKNFLRPLSEELALDKAGRANFPDVRFLKGMADSIPVDFSESAELEPILPFVHPKKNKRREVSLMGGPTIWQPLYGEMKPEREAYESVLPSFQVQANYFHGLKNNWTLMFGLQYQRLESRFERNFVLEEYTTILRDTIIEKQINVLSGKQTLIRGDVEISSQAERRVRHYNKTELWQIPFALGKSWDINKWRVDLFLGGSLNIYTQNVGKSTFQQEPVSYNGSSTRIIDNRSKVNALLAGRLSYQLDEHWGLSTGLQIQKSLQNWSPETGVQMLPGALGLQFGLNYGF